MAENIEALKAAYLDESVVFSVPVDNDFETILICAARYSCGRQTYMPSIVIDYIRSLLEILSKTTLDVLEKDIANAGNYGNETIDRPMWMQLLNDIRAEIKSREINR